MVEFLVHILQHSWGVGLAVIRSLAPFAGLFLLIGILVKGRQLFTDMQRATGETGLNLKLLFFNEVPLGLIAIPCAQIMVQVFVISGWTLIDPGTWHALPLALVMALAVVLGDLMGYWRHRLEHCRFLWPIHAIHHSDTEPTWLTVGRAHPLHWLLAFVTNFGALLLLGMPSEAIVANIYVRRTYSYLIHADLPWTYGPLGKVFVSPAMHRWHHSVDPRAFDTNFAVIFSAFDRLFGTWRVPGPCDQPSGVSDRIGPGFSRSLAYPFSPKAYRRAKAPGNLGDSPSGRQNRAG